MPPELLAQFPIAEAAVEALGIVLWPMVEFEADDAIAADARRRDDDAAAETSPAVRRRRTTTSNLSTEASAIHPLTPQGTCTPTSGRSS